MSNNTQTMNARIVGKGRTMKIVPFPKDATVLSISLVNEKTKEVSIEYRARAAKKGA